MLFLCTFKDFVGLMRTIYLGDGSISYDKQIGRSKFTTPVKILNYVLTFYFFTKTDHIRDTETPDRKGIKGKHVGNVSLHRLCPDVHHGIHKKRRSDGKQNDHDGHMGI